MLTVPFAATVPLKDCASVAPCDVHWPEIMPLRMVAGVDQQLCGNPWNAPRHHCARGAPSHWLAPVAELAATWAGAGGAAGAVGGAFFCASSRTASALAAS